MEINRDCSFHGHLIDGLCVCNKGWTGVGDYAIIDGLDCDINELLTTTLVWTSLIFGMVVMVLFGQFMISRLLTEDKFLTKKNVFVVFCFIQVIVCNIANIGLIMMPDQAIIGRSSLTTVLYSMAYTFGDSAAVIYLDIALGFLSKIRMIMSVASQEKMYNVVNIFRDRIKTVFIYFSYLGCTCACRRPRSTS
jgi:hypothetical protein